MKNDETTVSPSGKIILPKGSLKNALREAALIKDPPARVLAVCTVFEKYFNGIQRFVADQGDALKSMQQRLDLQRAIALQEQDRERSRRALEAQIADAEVRPVVTAGQAY